MARLLRKYVALILAFCAAVAAAQTDGGKKYVMFFPHQSSEIAPDAENVVEMAVAYLQSGAVKRIALTGYCDASEKGSAALAKARVKAAADKLRSLGLPKSIGILEKTSRDLVVPTAPGVSEPINRQVAITF